MRYQPAIKPLAVGGRRQVGQHVGQVVHASDGQLAIARLVGGDPNGDGTGGPGYQFEDELPEPEDYQAGSLAMANSGPNTNGSQFFIVTSEQGAESLVQAVGGTANYSLFGQVTEGMDVVKKIEADGDGSGTPKTVHKITKVTIKES